MEQFKMPVELVRTDLLLRMWGRATRDQLPRVRENPISRVMREGAGAAHIGHAATLPDELLAIDRIVAALPERTRAVVLAWYRTTAPAEAIGARMGVSRRTVYQRRREALELIRARFLEQVRAA